MKKLLLRLLVVLGFVLPLAPAAANEGGYPWDTFPRTKITDLAALQNGAQHVRQLLPELPLGARTCATTGCATSA